MNNDWSELEMEVIINDYFSMLRLEIQRLPVNKSEHRRNLQPFLNSRSEGSIEFKHANISAALIELGLPFIRGYKPRYNFQRTITLKVESYLKSQSELIGLFNHFADTIPKTPFSPVDFENWVVSPPNVANAISEPRPVLYSPIKINYLEREQYNRDLGSKGEQLVIEYEKYKLKKAGKYALSNQVEWVSDDKGDGLGFDILSKNLNGTDKFIEVKTTKLTRETPFFFTKREFQFSLTKTQDFHLYRVFDFENQPKMFNVSGSYDKFCQMEPIQYKGWI